MSEFATSLTRGSAYGAIGGSAGASWSLRSSTVWPALVRSLKAALCHIRIDFEKYFHGVRTL